MIPSQVGCPLAGLTGSEYTHLVVAVNTRTFDDDITRAGRLRRPRRNTIVTAGPHPSSHFRSPRKCE
nr:MAG TPA: hypothetical protein [Caudoviricetes sp.]